MYYIMLLVYIIVSLVIVSFCCFSIYNKQNIENDKEYMGSIPKVIMQTGPTMRSEEKGAKEWKTLNSGYSYVFFDNKKCREFIKKHFEEDILKTFDKLKPGAYKSDLFRYCYLYKNGGVYVDLDMLPNVSLDIILLPGYDMITVSDRGNIGVYQAFIACVPNISLFVDLIQMIVYYVENDMYIGNSLCITGPCLWKTLFNLYKSGSHKVQGYEIYMYENSYTNAVVKSGWFSLFNKALISNKGSEFRSDGNNLHYYNLYHNKLIYNADILFCTLYDDTIAGYADITSNINKMYCDKYGYDFVVDHTRRVPDVAATWERFPLILELMDKHPHKYIMWIDANACFNKKTKYTIEEIINSNKDFIFSEDISTNPINLGVFIVKNNKYTKKMIKHFMTYMNKPCTDYAGLDQCAVVTTYLENKDYIQHRSAVVPYGVLQYFPNYGREYKSLIIHAAGLDYDTRVRIFKDLERSWLE